MVRRPQFTPRSPQRLHGVVAAFACLSLGVLAGCREWTPPPGKSPLRSLELAPNESAVEFNVLRLEKATDAIETRLWTELDEFAVDAETRRKWTANGFRVGVFRGDVPPALQELISKEQANDAPKVAATIVGDEPQAKTAEVVAPGDLREERPTADQDGGLFSEVIQLDGAAKPAKTTDAGTLAPSSRLPKEGGTKVHTVYLQPNQEAQLQPGGVHDHWSFLLNDDGRVRGKSLTQAQGVWRISARPRGATTRIKLLPEIQHGEAKSHWVGEDGVFRQQLRKPTESLETLALEVPLQAGQALVVAPLADRPGSLAHYFLGAQIGGELQRRMIVIRIAKAAEDEIWK